MAQIHDEHLTTEQLSASFDKQLSPQEQAVFDAHISTCQQCQNKLSDLRLTAALLHALPEEEVPRSFVLPDNVSILPDRTIRQDAPVTALPQRQRQQRSVLRRSVRIVSTLAAVLALCFIISGMLPLLYSGAGNSASSTSSGSTFAPVHHGAATPGVHQPNSVFPSAGIGCNNFTHGDSSFAHSERHSYGTFEFRSFNKSRPKPCYPASNRPQSTSCTTWHRCFSACREHYCFDCHKAQAGCSTLIKGLCQFPAFSGDGPIFLGMNDEHGYC